MTTQTTTTARGPARSDSRPALGALGILLGALLAADGPLHAQGTGLGGGAGELPRLHARGGLRADAGGSIGITGAPPSSTAILLVGLGGSDPAPSDGDLHVRPDLVLGPFPVGPDGTLTLPYVRPDDDGVGEAVSIQAALIGPGGLQGMTLTNGARLDGPEIWGPGAGPGPVITGVGPDTVGQDGILTISGTKLSLPSEDYCVQIRNETAGLVAMTLPLGSSPGSITRTIASAPNSDQTGQVCLIPGEGGAVSIDAGSGWVADDWWVWTGSSEDAVTSDDEVTVLPSGGDGIGCFDTDGLVVTNSSGTAVEFSLPLKDVCPAGTYFSMVLEVELVVDGEPIGYGTFDAGGTLTNEVPMSIQSCAQAICNTLVGAFTSAYPQIELSCSTELVRNFDELEESFVKLSVRPERWFFEDGSFTDDVEFEFEASWTSYLAVCAPEPPSCVGPVFGSISPDGTQLVLPAECPSNTGGTLTLAIKSRHTIDGAPTSVEDEDAIYNTIVLEDFANPLTTAQCADALAGLLAFDTIVEKGRPDLTVISAPPNVLVQAPLNAGLDGELGTGDDYLETWVSAELAIGYCENAP